MCGARRTIVTKDIRGIYDNDDGCDVEAQCDVCRGWIVRPRYRAIASIVLVSYSK